MHYVLSEEQESFKESLRRFLQTRSGEADVRRLIEDDRGYDPDVWSQLATQLGLQGLQVPEQYGGAGLGHQELAVALEEMGRVLYGGPIFSTVVLAVNTLLEADDHRACEAYLPAIAAGECVATVAFTEDDGGWDLDQINLQAVDVGSGDFRLDGAKSFVLDGHVADLILVLGVAQTGPGLFAVSGRDLDSTSLTRTSLPTLDLTRRQTRLQFDNVPARQVGIPGQGAAVMRRVLALAAVALSAEQVGGAQKCLDMAVDYAKQRIQFGRPIGSFQAIKHKCAEMSLKLGAARSASMYASWCAATRSADLMEEASVAKAYCSETFIYAAAENLQIHGGIGFTWEHAAHLYLRRAKSSELFLGDGRYHRERVIQHLGL